MKSNPKISFWLFLAKINKKRQAPIYLRVTDGENSFTMATGKYIIPSAWNKKNMKVKGIDEESESINEFLDALRIKIQRIISQTIAGDKEVEIQELKQKLLGRGQQQNLLIEYYSEYLKSMVLMEGKIYQPATVVKYRSTLTRLKEFIKKTYKRKDVFLHELDFSFMDSFILFLRANYNNNQVTCYKHYQRFSRVINHAIKQGKLDKYPFFEFSIKCPKKQIEFLTMEEIERIDSTIVHIDRLQKIKDVFIFCCYSGLAYFEVESLRSSNIILGPDGNRWLYVHRQKTSKKYQVPLLPRALEILDLYLKPNSNERIFPVPSNVKYNAYLKEIAVLAHIDKNLTTHLARKSFSVSVMLTNGVSIGVLSKCLGHSDIRVTIDYYSRIVDERIIEEINALKEKLQLNKK